MKLKSMMMIFLGLLLLATNAFAKSAEGFHKRFEIIRKADGSLLAVRDRTLPVKFSVAPYVNMIKENMTQEQSLMTAENLIDGSYEQSVLELLSEEEELFVSNGGQRSEFERNTKDVVESLKKLAVLNIEGIFKNAKFNEVVAGYEKKMTEKLLILDPTIVANVDDAKFFYKRNVTYTAVNWGLNFAKKRLSEVPLLNTASFIIVEVERLITERRNFHQNMLLHYLENFKETELGLTPDEVNLIWSSIYESRIPWFAFWESNGAQANWKKYGVENFYYQFRLGTTKLRKFNDIYTTVDNRLNYAFQEVTYKNERVIVNLMNNESMFQKFPAIAYNHDRPKAVVRKRIMLNMAQLGLSFVPVHAMIKDQVEKFIKSYYVEQKITEGALYGYFESNKDQAGKKVIKAQYLNPFDLLAL